MRGRHQHHARIEWDNEDRKGSRTFTEVQDRSGQKDGLEKQGDPSGPRHPIAVSPLLELSPPQQRHNDEE